MFREKSHRTYALSLLFLAVVSGCAGKKPKEDYGPEVMGPVITDHKVDEEAVPPEAYGPVAQGPVTPPPAAEPAPTATITNTATNTTVSTDSPRLCIVLGPGMAKAMAEAAVLESIRRAKLPVHCVVGTEMGAIVGALYAHSNGSTNNLQWQLFKFNKNNYFNFPMLSLHDPKSTGQRLNEFLRGLFKEAHIESLPIKFATTAVDDDTDSSVELDKGALADALSASAAVPGIFDSWKIGESSFRSAAVADPAPMELARKLGGNFIVLVDVLIEGAAGTKSRFHRAFTSARSLMKLQKKDASFVIEVNTSTIAFDDFARKGEILAAGAASMEKALPELKAAWERWSAGPR
ncbi:MAG TPA: patatin-like phospholipase family protein [Bdellovibrionota bacterium]|jgi:NTE family protein